MKRICKIGLIMAVLMAVITIGAAAKGQGGGGAAQTTIGLLVKNRSDTFPRVISETIVAEAKTKGINVIVSDAEMDVNKQLQQAEDMITQKVSGIIMIAVDTDGSAPIVDKAIAAGIPIVECNTTTNNVEKVVYVGSDDVDAAKIQADYIKSKLKPGIRVVQMLGAMGQSSQVDRSKGIDMYLKNDPSFKVEYLAEQTANWKTDVAMALAENWLASYNNNIDVIICQNDEMAIGASQAVVAKGLKDKVMVLGIDAIPGALQLVQKGELDATVFQDAVGQGKGGLEAILDLISKGRQENGRRMIPFKLVTRENVADFL
ncbi:MAG: substrate-binding domain-containing protein [Treponema sp.]|jgi:ABC-type sugar transport system substrate-binding protein|nr:substrate-binding domain-containing protein [Treponema sp.]